MAQAAKEVASQLLQMETPTMDMTDCSAIYYVCGALARAELKLRKDCRHCSDILLKSKEECSVPITDPMADESVQLFVEKISRGGLLYPSQFSYSLCLRSWRVFCQLRYEKDLMAVFYRQKCQESFFVSLVFHLIEVEDDTDGASLAHLCCLDGHTIGYSITNRFFRCLIKNLMKKLTADVAMKKTTKRKNSNAAKISGKAK